MATDNVLIERIKKLIAQMNKTGSLANTSMPEEVPLSIWWRYGHYHVNGAVNAAG